MNAGFLAEERHGQDRDAGSIIGSVSSFVSTNLTIVTFIPSGCWFATTHADEVARQSSVETVLVQEN